MKKGARAERTSLLRGSIHPSLHTRTISFGSISPALSGWTANAEEDEDDEDEDDEDEDEGEDEDEDEEEDEDDNDDDDDDDPEVAAFAISTASTAFTSSAYRLLQDLTKVFTHSRPLMSNAEETSAPPTLREFTFRAAADRVIARRAMRSWGAGRSKPSSSSLLASSGEDNGASDASPDVAAAGVGVCVVVCEGAASTPSRTVVGVGMAPPPLPLLPPPPAPAPTPAPASAPGCCRSPANAWDSPEDMEDAIAIIEDEEDNEEAEACLVGAGMEVPSGKRDTA